MLQGSVGKVLGGSVTLVFNGFQGFHGFQALWPPAFAQRVAELALSCTQMQEDGAVVLVLKTVVDAGCIHDVRVYIFISSIYIYSYKYQNIYISIFLIYIDIFIYIYISISYIYILITSFTYMCRWCACSTFLFTFPPCLGNLVRNLGLASPMWPGNPSLHQHYLDVPEVRIKG